jgi:2-methylisocitrate lyase-like PEP mutase family enzyme
MTTRAYDPSVTDRASTQAADFMRMHQGPGFVLPNAWGAASAKVLAHAGFGAIATTSAGIAFATGRPDGTMARDDMLDRVAAIVDAVDCPVSADLEAGYGDTPGKVAETIGLAVEIGVVGANLEDSDPRSRELFDIGEATERLAAAHDAVPAAAFVLNARIDTYLSSSTGSDSDRFSETIRRAEAYVDAGADCIFVPGVGDHGTIARLAGDIAAPLNIVVGLGQLEADAATLFSLGVTRITTGGSLARAALGYVARAAEVMGHAGRFDFISDAIPHGELQQRFATSAHPTESRP